MPRRTSPLHTLSLLGDPRTFLCLDLRLRALLVVEDFGMELALASRDHQAGVHIAVDIEDGAKCTGGVLKTSKDGNGLHGQTKLRS